MPSPARRRIMPGAHSKLGYALARVTVQLKSGKTRSAIPRDLEPAELEDLRQRARDLKAQMAVAAKERAVARVNAHTTVEADRVIEQVVECAGELGELEE